MSFHTIAAARSRLNRSELAVPGSRPELFAKAARSPADIVFLDLEDAVAPDEKPAARAAVIRGLNEVDWGAKVVSVRINGLDTPFMYRDVIEVVEACPRLDLMMIPKVGTAADVYAVDMLVSQIEAAIPRERRLGLELIIESALGMQNLEAIAAASRRTESLHFGVADYAASTRARTTGIGGANPGYAVLTAPLGDGGARALHWGDQWHYALARLVVVARANGLRPLDGPFGDFSDPEGFTAAARRAAALGCEGKWAIHPSQVGLANQVFTPSAEEIAQARRILAAMAEAQAAGKGAVSLDGKLIDIASIRQAEAMVAAWTRAQGG